MSEWRSGCRKAKVQVMPRIIKTGALTAFLAGPDLDIRQLAPYKFVAIARAHWERITRSVHLA